MKSAAINSTPANKYESLKEGFLPFSQITTYLVNHCFIGISSSRAKLTHAKADRGAWITSFINNGIKACVVLSILLIALKLTSISPQVHWSWFLALAPVWMPALFVALLLSFIGVIGIVQLVKNQSIRAY